MANEQLDLFNKIYSLQEQLTQLQTQYWYSYSSASTWQFFIIVIMFCLPLAILYIFIDEEKIFLLGFYGLNIHIWFTLVDQIGIRLGYWKYPYQLIPVLQYSFALDATIVPVAFILVYQWTLKHKKNFYIYSTITSVIFAFIVKPLLTTFSFFKLYKGINYFNLFILYVLIFIFSKIITKLFILKQKKAIRIKG